MFATSPSYFLFLLFSPTLKPLYSSIPSSSIRYIPTRDATLGLHFLMFVRIIPSVPFVFPHFGFPHMQCGKGFFEMLVCTPRILTLLVYNWNK